MNAAIINEVANILRNNFGRCAHSSFKQIGLRYVREAKSICNAKPDTAGDLLREASLLLEKARAFKA